MRFTSLLFGVFICFFCGNVSAVSFDCKKTQTDMEKMICSDEGLSILDDELDKAFKNVVKKMQNPDVIRTWQKDWVASFALDGCHDVNCWKDQFTRRISLLNQVALDGQNLMRNATYKRYYRGKPDKNTAVLTVVALKDNKFNVTGSAYWLGPNSKEGQVNMGSIADNGIFDGKYFVVGQKEKGCQIKFKWVGKNKLNVVADNLECGGLNVSFVGEYIKTR